MSLWNFRQETEPAAADETLSSRACSRVHFDLERDSIAPRLSPEPMVDLRAPAATHLT